MERENIFESGSIRKTYFALALPVTFNMVLSVVYNVADTYFISRTQNTDLVAAVSLCGPIFMIMMAFGNIFGQGGASKISRLYGSGDLSATKKVSSFCFWAAVAVGVLLGGAMLLLHRPLLSLLGTTEETYPYALEYYMTMSAGAPFLTLNFIHMNLLRSEGMSKESMFGSAGGILINIILDPIFISVFHWDAFGAALATVIGYIFTDVFLFIIVQKKSRILSVKPKIARISGRVAAEIVTVGLSVAITNILSSICTILTNQFLLPYGNDRIAAMGISHKVSMIVFLVMIGMTTGAAPIVGYYYGARSFVKLKKLLRFLCLVVGGTVAVTGLILYIAAKPFVGLFLEDPAIVEQGSLMLRWQVALMLFAAAAMIISVCFQASGMAAEALIISFLRQGIVFFVVIEIFARVFGYMGIITAQAATDVITALICGTLFFLRFWPKIRNTAGGKPEPRQTGAESERQTEQ